MIHSTAIIHSNARIGANCEIGPYCVIGGDVELGEGCRLHSHVVIDGHTRLGRNNEIFSFAAIGKKTQDLKWKGGVTRVEIGDDNTIRECVTIHSATSDGDATVIGSNNLLLTYVHVAHDCRLGNNIILSSYVGLAGHIIVEDFAIVGGQTGVHQFCRIGKFSMVGGGSAVRQDVPPFMLIEGNPPKTVFINKIGLERNGFSAEAVHALKQAYKILFRDGLTVSNALAAIEKNVPQLPEVVYLTEFARASQRGICPGTTGK